MTRIAPLPYCADPAPMFEAVADMPWAMLLDGGAHDSAQSRYDIIVAEPWATLVTRAGVSQVHSPAGARTSADDPFRLLRDLLQPARPRAAAAPAPFAGGAIGYFGYDLGRRLERLPDLAADDEGLPELAVGVYDWAVVIDHLTARAWLAGAERAAQTAQQWPALIERFSRPPAQRGRLRFRSLSSIRSNMTRSRYLAAFERVARYIEDGDCYQVNLAQRFEVRASGDPWRAYQTLRVLNPAPHAAYLNLPFAQVLSASPERFLHVRDGHVQTRPIKGTRARASESRLDAARAQELRESAKDRAENVMIVDLLRNDLAKSCRPGSVRVPRLFEVESFASVHHLVSTVTGELAPGRDALDLLRGCFPGGSVTGAPKVRAMQIIEELEAHRRGIYCGSIGYIGYDGAMDCNIAIRTLVYRSGYARFWAGGGIVADSVGAQEYQETLDKAAPFLRMMGRAGTGNDD
ncbi:MAG: aminodeoxychorismate synthase component I [Burkholderiales bacterium]|nr:aminodeoxychorismate synthase component I [Burkholderiales bacterium]